MPTGTDHAHRAPVIQSKTFDVLNRETGEQCRVIIEQVDTGTHVAWPSRTETFDVLVEDFEEQEQAENIDILVVSHPYTEGR